MIAPLVSAIIPVYNAESFLVDTLESVLGQSYPNIEIWAIDDDSSDGSPEILKHYSNRIHMLCKENGGPASARNLGIRMAKGTYLAFLDADDQWLPDKIAAQVGVLEKHRNVGLVHTGCISLRNGKESYRKLGDFPFILKPQQAFSKLFNSNFIVTSSVLVRANAFQECGLFNESMDYFAVEDYDAWLRICGQMDIAYLSKRLTKYRTHPQGISRNTDRSYTNERNIVDSWVREHRQFIKENGINIRRRYERLYNEWSEELLWCGLPGKACLRSAKTMLKCGPSSRTFKNFFKAILLFLAKILKMKKVDSQSAFNK